MNNLLQRLEQHLPLRLSMILLAATAFLAAGASPASGLPQTSSPSASSAAVASPVARIAGEVNGAELTPIPNSKLPKAQAQFDTGRLAGATKLQGMSIRFSRTQDQEAAVKALMVAQQSPGSSLYHQWLNPDQFASRFGLADSDISKVQSWLEQQGFSVDWVARSKNMVRFSGTAAQVEKAFATEMHTYVIKTAAGTENHYAPSTALSIPAALAGVVESVHNLDNFRPRSHLVKRMNINPTPKFSGYDGSIYFAPGDITLQYDIQKAYNASFTGTGQTIAVVGQSQILLSDIEAFESAAGLPVKDPSLFVVPGTGSPAISPGDETESDLDVEWSGAIAKGATIDLVYSGASDSNGALDALQYAIDERIANIVSSSYGECEAGLGGYSLESTFEQAATQGQTILAAAGDDGSTDCFGETGFTTAQQEALGVDYPGSSPNVTSVGGTEISQASASYETQGGAYWSASNGSTDVINSLLQPVPEQAWNEDSTCVLYVSDGGSALCSGGGGASALFTKPSWQINVPGIPTDGQRDVPDVSLDAAVYNPGYLYCSSDSSEYQEGQESSCTSGFRDSATGDITAAGGTSFASPIFAGMLAIINQQQGYTTGYGPANPELYTLASNSTTYGSAFNDIKTGNNECDATGYCSTAGKSGYAAGTGYDQATGLGTINFYNLAGAWPANSGASAALIDTSTTVMASSTTLNVGSSDTFTIAVAPDTGTGVPTGTVTITVDQLAPVTESLTSNGTYVYNTSFTTAGTHVVFVSYSGDSTYAASTGSASVTVTAVNSGTGTFTMSATSFSVPVAGNGASTITKTPAGGYTGTVVIGLSGSSNNTALENLCYEFTNMNSSGEGTIGVTSAAAVTTQLSLDANASDCASTDATANHGKHSFRSALGVKTSSNTSGSGGIKTAPATIAFAGLLLAGFMGRYSRKFRSMAGVIALVAVGLAVSACGGNSNGSTTIPNPPPGTYTIDLTATDSVTSTITATTSFTFTITAQ